MAENLEVEAVHLVAPEPPLVQPLMNQPHQLLVDEIPVGVIDGVIEMGMLEGVHIEIHLAVGTEPVGIKPEPRQPEEYVIDRSDRHLGIAVFVYVSGHHVGTRMPELEHGLMDSQPLRGCLKVMVSEKRLEFLYGRRLPASRVHLLSG